MVQVMAVAVRARAAPDARLHRTACLMGKRGIATPDEDDKSVVTFQTGGGAETIDATVTGVNI
jgi:hypothetical protein